MAARVRRTQTLLIAVHPTEMEMSVGSGFERLAVTFASTPSGAPVELHLNISELYRRKVSDLEGALNGESINAEAAELLRSLIDKVVLSTASGAQNRLKAELHDDLASGARKQKLSSGRTLGESIVGCGGAQLP